MMYEHKLNDRDVKFVKEMELEFCKKLLNGISVHNWKIHWKGIHQDHTSQF